MRNGACEAGAICGAGNDVTGKQERPNGCADIVCGRTDPERCCAAGDLACVEPTPLEGECSGKQYISCSTDPDDPCSDACELENAGECIATERSCFGSTIERTGAPSPMGDHCIGDSAVGQCTSNSNCGAGECVGDSAEPIFVGLFCIPKTASAAINAAAGFPGPGAISLSSTVLFCRCGDGELGCNEQCDDGNFESGDGCDPACRDEGALIAHR